MKKFRTNDFIKKHRLAYLAYHDLFNKESQRTVFLKGTVRLFHGIIIMMNFGYTRYKRYDILDVLKNYDTRGFLMLNIEITYCAV